MLSKPANWPTPSGPSEGHTQFAELIEREAYHRMSTSRLAENCLRIAEGNRNTRNDTPGARYYVLPPLCYPLRPSTFAKGAFESASSDDGFPLEKLKKIAKRFSLVCRPSSSQEKLRQMILDFICDERSVMRFVWKQTHVGEPPKELEESLKPAVESS